MSQGSASLPSVVQRATHIMLIQLESATVGEWVPAPTGGVRRPADLRLRIEETLKGLIDQRPGDLVETQVIQYGTGTTRYAGVLGVWSHEELTPGDRLVAFCTGDSTSAAELLRDPLCTKLLPADQSLADVRLALQTEPGAIGITGLVRETPPTLKEFLALSEPDAPSLGQVFAGHLWATYGAEALSKLSTFDVLVHFMERPDLGHVARATLLDEVFGAVIAASEDPPKRAERLALALFRLLAESGASRLHDTIVDVFLPNLLGLTGSLRLISAGDVFRVPKDRDRARAALDDYRGPAPKAELVRWINE